MRDRRSAGPGRRVPTGEPETDRREGFTLLELVVVVAILGVLAALVAASWERASGSPEAEPGAAPLTAARREAARLGASVTVTLIREGGPVVVTALPDGRLLGAEGLGINPLSGRQTTDGTSR